MWREKGDAIKEVTGAAKKWTGLKEGRGGGEEALGEAGESVQKKRKVMSIICHQLTRPLTHNWFLGQFPPIIAVLSPPSLFFSGQSPSITSVVFKEDPREEGSGHDKKKRELDKEWERQEERSERQAGKRRSKSV